MNRTTSRRWSSEEDAVLQRIVGEVDDSVENFIKLFESETGGTRTVEAIIQRIKHHRLDVSPELSSQIFKLVKEERKAKELKQFTLNGQSAPPDVAVPAIKPPTRKPVVVAPVPPKAVERLRWLVHGLDQDAVGHEELTNHLRQILTILGQKA